MTGAAYHPAYQAATTTTGPTRCPYCPFVTPDAVLMVDHVETIHNNNVPVANPENPLERSIAVLGGSRIFGLEPTVPVVTLPPTEIQGPAEDEKHKCPHCRFVTLDAVILVNHVHVMHAQ
eukprot:jgi/Phyca11/504090/fgenesh2_kg.PHYCAscaffold_6_\